MLLSSVVLVLREALEAALLFSLLMVLSRRLGGSFRWVLLALCAGLLGAVGYGFNIDLISEWYDGVGQEVVNAVLQLAIFLLICVLTFLVVLRVRAVPVSRNLLLILMACSVALAVVREGSEVMIYLSAFMQLPDQRMPVIIGSAIGAGIGVSVGVVFYYALLSLGGRAAIMTGAFFLALVAAAMVSQAVQLLTQADWLPAQYPVWDSSWLVSEQSVTGQLLYALVGYEATPTALQLAAYALAVLTLCGLAMVAARVASTRGLGRA